LAARNVLLHDDGSGLHAVVSDMGLSRVASISGDGAHKSQADTGPLNWMAPESIRTNLWSEKSDVYSFGVTAYELYSAEEPWADVTAVEAATLVAAGEVLTWPDEYMAAELQNLLSPCFAFDSSERPSFEALVADLGDDAFLLLSGSMSE
jgi:epidermal growth factor receptor